MPGPDHDRGVLQRGVPSADRIDEERDAAVAGVATQTTVGAMVKVGQVVGDEVGVLLHHANRLLDRFVSAPGPLTRRAVAAELLETYCVLHEHEVKAPRGAGGQLLKEVKQGQTVVQVPWVDSGPTRLEEVRVEESTRLLFSRENLDLWSEAVSYRPAPAPARRGRRPAARARDEGVEVLPLTLVRRSGTGPRRQVLPWPLPNLIVPNAYKIKLVKAAGMSFFSEPGRLLILAFLIEVLADVQQGQVWQSRTEEWVDPIELARHMTAWETVKFGRVVFTGPDSAFKVFEHAAAGEDVDFIVTDKMLDILRDYTNIAPKFRSDRTPEQKRGCAAIEWLFELLSDVPVRYKQLWIQNRLQNERGVYPDNLKPGMMVPAGYFLTEDVARALSKRDGLVEALVTQDGRRIEPPEPSPLAREIAALGRTDYGVIFIGSYTDNDRIILTPDGRIWLIKQRERNEQSYCQAVIQTQGILTLTFILASTIGACLGGPFVNLLITAGDVAIDVNEAGGILNFLKGLKNDPKKAAWFALDLFNIIHDIKGSKNLLMNPHETLEASMRHAEQQVAKGLGDVPKGVPRDPHAPAGGGTLPHGAGTVEPPRGTGDTGTGALGKGVDAPPSGRPTSEARAADTANDPLSKLEGTRAGDPLHAEPARPKDKPEVEIEAGPSGGRAPEGAAESSRAGKDIPPQKPTQVDAPPATGEPPRARAPGPVAPARAGKRPGKAPSAPISNPVTVTAKGGRTGAKASDLRRMIGGIPDTKKAVQRLKSLKCGELALDIAEEFGQFVTSAREFLAKVAKLPDEQILGLAAVRRALANEPMVRTFEKAEVMMDWMDVFNHFPPKHRGELLQLIARVEPLVDKGLTRALARGMEGGRFTIQGALGHFHAAAHVAEEYKSRGVRMIMEEPVWRDGRLREIDIRATVGGNLTIDIEVKTYLGQLQIYPGVRGQIEKDLIRRIDGRWEGLRYLYSPNMKNELGQVRQAIMEVFEWPKVQEKLRAAGFDPDKAREILQRRLDDVGHPMVDVYEFGKID